MKIGRLSSWRRARPGDEPRLHGSALAAFEQWLGSHQGGLSFQMA